MIFILMQTKLIFTRKVLELGNSPWAMSSWWAASWDSCRASFRYVWEYFWSITVHFQDLLQNTTMCYYNSRQLGLLQITTTCYYNLRQLGYYNYRQLVLQVTTAMTIHDRTGWPYHRKRRRASGHSSSGDNILFNVSHVNRSPPSAWKCMKRWLTQGRSAGRETLLPATGFLHINGAWMIWTLRNAYLW